MLEATRERCRRDIAEREERIRKGLCVSKARRELMEKMREEAIKRMKRLKMLPMAIESFEKDGGVFISEYQGEHFPAVLYSIELNISQEEYQEIKDYVKKFEEDSGNLVYHVIKDKYGCMDFLYVTAYEEDWELDWADLDNNVAVAYVMGDFKECGTIGIKSSMGGVERTA